MEKNKKRSQPLRLLVIATVALIGIVGIRLLSHSETFSTEDWLGTWEMQYYYEPDTTLIYEGTLHLTMNDSLSGYLEVYPPKSTRPEKLILENLLISQNNASMTGQIVHKSYRIKGGHLKEAFSLTYTEPNELRGEGECLAYCAEGTVGVKIIWSGSKSEGLN